MQRPPRFRGTFRTDDVARALYAEGAGIFRIVPAAVAVPESAEDLPSLLSWAREEGRALIPRGAGSGMPGHNVGSGVVVDLTRACRQAPEVDAERRAARAGASVTCRELSTAAGAAGLRMPSDPSSAAFCTLGGMVATNAAGARSLKYGAMRRWVQALDFVTADGEAGRAADGDAPGATAAERRFYADVVPGLTAHHEALAARRPATPKNASGYELAPADGTARTRELLVGSEGTLAFITAVEVRLAPVPDMVSTLLVTLGALGDVKLATAALAPFAPAAVELLDRTYLDFVRAAAHAHLPPRTEAVLLVELEDDGRAAEAALAGIATQVLRAGDSDAAARLWELRHLASPILAGLPDNMRSLQIVEDGCVPPERLGAYVAGLRRLAEAHGFGIVIFGHAGDAHVHANVLADVSAADVVTRLSACLAEVSALQMDLGGTLSGEHGDGRLRAPFLGRLLGDDYLGWCRKTKDAWDPAGVLNPGVKLPLASQAAGLAADMLKVGPGAPALPEGIAAQLRRIEKDAAWATFRLDLAPPAS